MFEADDERFRCFICKRLTAFLVLGRSQGGHLAILVTMGRAILEPMGAMSPMKL